MIECAWIGIGSNLLDPKKQVDCAIEALDRLPKTKLILQSKYYKSRPLGQQDQPDFLNTVVALYTSLKPEILLDYMHKIEQQQGRIRNFLSSSFFRWGPRTLDLDILLFGKYTVCTSNLIIPHYDMKHREFVIYPLIELDYNLMFPNGETIIDISNCLPLNGLTLWKD